MQMMLSFRASSVTQEDIGRILADYLALDRARIVRRLMVSRFGVLAGVAILVETVVHGFSGVARAVTLGLCLLPPAWAWVVELMRERRVLLDRQCLDSGGAA